jgi:hypothetical protein
MYESMDLYYHIICDHPHLVLANIIYLHKHNTGYCADVCAKAPRLSKSANVHPTFFIKNHWEMINQLNFSKCFFQMVKHKVLCVPARLCVHRLPACLSPQMCTRHVCASTTVCASTAVCVNAQTNPLRQPCTQLF